MISLWSAARLVDVVERVAGTSYSPDAVRAVLERLNRERDESLAYTTVKDAAQLAVRDVVRDHGEAAVTYLVDQARSDPMLAERPRRLLGNGPDSSPDRRKPDGLGRAGGWWVVGHAALLVALVAFALYAVMVASYLVTLASALSG